MIENELIYLIFLGLTILQSIAGVGVLVVGTPAMLSLNFNIVDTMFTLLPISIITSFLNFVFLKYFFEKKIEKIEKNLKIIFLTVCIPSIFFGLIILKNYENIFNLKYFVASVIFLSIIITSFKNLIKFFNSKFNIFFLFFTGIVHGITNSGGSLLSLFLSTNQEKDRSRYNITFFYLFLAFFQFLILIYIFGINNLNLNIKNLLFIIPLGVIIGNFISNYLNSKTLRHLITFFSLISVISLLVND